MINYSGCSPGCQVLSSCFTLCCSGQNQITVTGKQKRCYILIDYLLWKRKGDEDYTGKHAAQFSIFYTFKTTAKNDKAEAGENDLPLRDRTHKGLPLILPIMSAFLLLFLPPACPSASNARRYKPGHRAWSCQQLGPASTSALLAAQPLHLSVNSSQAEVTAWPPRKPSRELCNHPHPPPKVRGEGVPFLCSIRHHLRSAAGCWLRWTWPCSQPHALHRAKTADAARCDL